MTRFVATILLTLAICSCRVTQQSASERVESADVGINTSGESLADDEILSFIVASRELDLTGVQVEFFPPDSACTTSRPAPKTLKIERASAKESSRQASHETTSVDTRNTVSFTSHTSDTQQEQSDVDSSFMRPADWVLCVSALGIIFAGFVFIWLRFK